MGEFISELAAKAGIDNTVAEKAVGAMLGFLRKEGPAEQVRSLIEQIPGAENAIKAAGSGGLAGMLGGGIMALGAKLMGMGLGMSEIQNLARELFKFGRDKIGADGMRTIIAETPGLSKFA
jgi:hypothetical protein